MEKLKHEIPSLSRKEDAISYINEFYEYGSRINGSGKLDDYLDDYEGWLKHLKWQSSVKPDEEHVPALTYFLVRESDNKIVGMLNIRLTLNNKLKNSGGHIGYGIRPTERKKGYNKINLYLGLKECRKHGITEAELWCNRSNIGSSSTMKALGGVLSKSVYNKFIITINLEPTRTATILRTFIFCFFCRTSEPILIFT